MSNLCTCLLVLTLRLENKTPSYRISMPARQRTGWFVLHMLPHWLFITAARYEKRLHPSPSSNEFLHGDSIQGAGVSNGLSLKKDREWAAIIPCMTELRDWRDMGWERQVWGVDGTTSSFLNEPFFLNLVPQNIVLLWANCRQPSCGEPCTCTNELCSCMHLWWLPSPAALIPAGYKQEGRRKVTNNCNSNKSISTKAGTCCQVQGVLQDRVSNGGSSGTQS